MAIWNIYICVNEILPAILIMGGPTWISQWVYVTDKSGIIAITSKSEKVNLVRKK